MHPPVHEARKRKMADGDHTNCHLDDDVNCVRLQRKLIQPHAQEDAIDDTRECVLLPNATKVGPPKPHRTKGSCCCILKDKKVSPYVGVEAVEEKANVDDSEDQSRGWGNACHRAWHQLLVSDQGDPYTF